MPTRTEAWPEGTPHWIELAVDDSRAAVAFYRELFGWVCLDAGENEGEYLLAFKDGFPVAAIGVKQVDGTRANWSTYLAVEDADLVAKRVSIAGGVTHSDPVEVGPNGRMLVASDPDGASFGVWEAGEHIGVGIFNEPGTLAWSVLHSNDQGRARDFYAEVFGYTYRDLSTPEVPLFTVLRDCDGADVAAMSSNTIAPPGTPPHWLNWFAVVNCDGSAIIVCRLGGRVLVEPHDTPFGRTAIVCGPEREVFGLVDLSTAQKVVALAPSAASVSPYEYSRDF
jgi:uncharacterized protein